MFLISLLFFISFLYLFLLSTFFSISILYSVFFNIFSALIFLLFEIRCKFVLAIIISCAGYKYPIWAIITICSDLCSDLF
jgi:hypothetical protein